MTAYLADGSMEDKLLNKLEESEPELPTSQEDECVICINARATMQTSPCGHRVVCRRCFVKTIQSAVAQRLLPLRCVICRTRINRLTSSSGTWRLQESASTYSMGANKTWSVPGSASSYSVGSRVAQSASLYSMSSGSSCTSGNSLASTGSTNSDTSGTSSAISSISNCSSTTNKSHSNLTHYHGSSCSQGCLGAIPRNTHKRSNSYHHYTTNSKGRITELQQQNRLPPIKEFRSPAKSAPTTPAEQDEAKGIGTIEKSTIQTKSISNQPIGNPKIRFASYTQEKPPLLNGDSRKSVTKALNGRATAVKPPSGGTKTTADKRQPARSPFNGHATKPHTETATIPPNNCDEKADNKKNECMVERKKKEEKLRLKAEKEAKKEEKRVAKEEEKLAKLLAKEEKKKRKGDGKELLLPVSVTETLLKISPKK